MNTTLSAQEHTSIWLGTTSTTSYPTYSVDVSTDPVDVVVVGGGLAGITTAFLLQQAGQRVVVLEAAKLCEGVTGHTTAHITIAHELIYDHLIKHFDLEGAALYANANQTAIDTIDRLQQELRIECDFHRVSEYVFAERPDELEALKKEYQALKKIHFLAEWLESAPLPFKTLGAIHYPNQAQFHPRKYALGLAEAFVAMGGKIFEHTRVTDVTEAEPCVVKTPQGELQAKKVIIATHFPILDRGLFFARMKPERSYVIAAKTTGEASLAMFDSVEDPSHYIRTQETPQGRLLIIGGEDHGTGEAVDTEQHYQQLEEYARARFPIESIVYRWSTQDNYTFDRVPYVGKYMPTAKHLYVATGFNGWGMTNSTVAGLLLTDLVLGRPNPWAALYSPQRYKPELEAVPEAQMGWTTFKDKVIEKIRPKKYQVVDDLQKIELKPGTAKVVTHHGKHVAVYKDRHGQVHAVGAECSHMGCVLQFNNAEESWDCPCHGSRFSAGGEVLHSPAVHPLPKV